MGEGVASSLAWVADGRGKGRAPQPEGGPPTPRLSPHPPEAAVNPAMALLPTLFQVHQRINHDPNGSFDAVARRLPAPFSRAVEP